MKLAFDLFKLRIGVVISLTALAGVAVTPGPSLAAWQIIVLAFAVLLSSASAGAFNQYMERDLDQRMARTRARPFVTGALKHGPAWLWLIGLLVAAAVLAAALAINLWSAFYTFLGAFFYGFVYTVWLKRRTSMNIVIGGLAGSFAVLAGSSAVTPALSPEAIALAVVLFLWTPPHFWSLSIACRKDYEATGVPMLPVVVGDERCARVILASTLLLVAASLVPSFYGMGWIYLAAACVGGVHFIRTSLALVAAPGRQTAMANFHASLLQLSLLIFAAMIEGVVRA
jgi:protoheme IX farnesyltransferase